MSPNFVSLFYKWLLISVQRLRKNDDIDLPAVGAIHPAGGINLVIDADLARIGRIEFDEDWDNPGLGLLPIMEEDEMGLESGMMDSSGIRKSNFLSTFDFQKLLEKL